MKTPDKVDCKRRVAITDGVEYDAICEPQEWIDSLVVKYAPRSHDTDVAIQNMGLEIKELNHELGMLGIQLDHKTTLLVSCERALEDRDVS